MFRFVRYPVIFNTHTIFLTKSISSLFNLKSNNYKKSGTRIRNRGEIDDGDDDDAATTTTTTTTITTTKVDVA